MEEAIKLVLFDVVMQLWGSPSHGITTTNCNSINVNVVLVELDVSML